MHTLKLICLFALGMSFLAYPCVLHGQDEIDAEIREEMTALHDEVRTPGLAAIRRNHNLSNDEFSARLVKLATTTTNGGDATLRMFTVAALGDFGTTNALKFLESEALQGRDATGGVTGYGKVSGFDDSFFDLAEKILADTSRKNRYRRVAVYDVYRSLLTLDKPYWRPISKRTRAAAKESLLRAAVNEDAYSAYVDDILMHGMANYANNPQRLQIAQRIVQMRDVSDYTRNYFKTILEQMERDNVTTKDGASSVAGARDSGKQADTNMAVRTLGLDVESVEDLSFVDNADVDVPSTHTWLYMMIGGVLLLAGALFFARMRRQRQANHNSDHNSVHQ